MQVKIIMQKENENTIASAISNCLENNAKKAYFFIGNFKETGYKIVEEDLIDIKTKLFFAIGIDKKATTRNMLEGLLGYTDDVYYYSNNDVNEYVANIQVFEYTDRAEVLVSTSNLSESGIQTDLSIYTKITYNLKDAEEKKEYKEQIKALTNIVESEGFNKLTKKVIEQLVEDKEIFSTRQYNHSVMSISELLGKKPKVEEKKELTKEEADDVFVQDIEIPKVDLSDISIDIDIPEEMIEKESKKVEDDIAIDYKEDEYSIPQEDEYEDILEEKEEKKEKTSKKLDEIDKNNELYDESMANDDVDLSGTVDINDLLFSKADVKLDLKSEKTTKRKSSKKKEVEDDENEIVKVKKLNLNNITSLIFEMSSKNSKETNTIRIPNQIRTMLPEFFGIESADNREINGINYKVKDIKLEIVDVKNNQKYTDNNAMITYKARQSYLSFVSDKLDTILYNENDIARIIKLSDDEYHIEIVGKEMQEYKVWNKLCTQKFRASEKKYGVM